MIYPDVPGDGTDPCSPVRIHATDGARLIAASHGGHVLGWIPAGAERDRLWLSPLARCGPGEAIRGGIPVVFPQFAGRGPLPKHGFARDRTWALDMGSDGATTARLAGELRDDDGTRAVWPHRFTLTLVAEASGDELVLTLQVRNDAGPGGDPFTFTAALHTYLAVDATAARLHGLAGRDAEDNTRGGGAVRLPGHPLPGLGPVDLAVRGRSGPVQLDDGLGGRLEIRADADAGPGGAPGGEAGSGQDGFDSLVVWNPGHGHGIGDVPPEGAAHFLCVEPARLTPVSVEPQGAWRAQARLTALVPDRP